MPPKQQPDKGNWQWAETTDPSSVTLENIRTAYRLDVNTCTLGQCKRNCKKNPFCINAIGEKVWFGKIDDKTWHDVEDPEAERRTAGTFVGLKNLGATCYVNTFLQLWFHNPKVRQAICDWRGKEDEKSVEKWKPSSVCGHLQVIFGLLKSSKRRYVDPSEFISFLGLDAGQQQDAQEFSKLFLSILEENLMQSTATNPRNVIRDLFCGSYAYVTKCSNCASASERLSDFYELDLSIRGHKTLEDAVKGFLEVEKLEGDNQYMCEKCNSKQNATRAIQLKSLPPVLNLQLLRFVFEKNRGQKKKLNSFIQFPDILDMCPYVSGPALATYDLTAVLIHRGPSAYSGHYVAHIRGETDQTWYKFNDEEVEKIKGRGLQLGNEEDPVESPQKKGMRTQKGYHSSRNAYMLVYTKRGAKIEPEANGSIEVPNEILSNQNQSNRNKNNSAKEIATVAKQLPTHVSEYVENDNKSFENWVSEMETMKMKNIQSGKQKQENLKSVFAQMIYKNDGHFEWVPMPWLTKWLSNPSVVPAIDNKPYVCAHGKLDPAKVGKLKCVASEGVENLFQQHGGGPRLVGNSALCQQCVKNTCSIIRTKKKVAEDDKLFHNAMKTDFSGETCYWIGKSSFRSWRRLALERVVEKNPETSEEFNNSSMDHSRLEDEKDENLYTKKAAGVEAEEEDEDEKLEFNEDLLCDCQQGLDPDATNRKLVPEKVWLQLKTYFAGCPEFKSDAPVCEKCQSNIVEELISKDMKKQVAVEQKNALSDLYLDKKRPVSLATDEQVYAVSSLFVESWRQFIKNPQTSDCLMSLMNGTLLCVHGRYLYPPAEHCLKMDDRVTYLWPQEWSALKQFYKVDSEITIINLTENGHSSIVCIPQVCNECLVKRLQNEENEKFVFKDEIIYVRKVINSKVPAPGGSENGDDPDFEKKKSAGKKRSGDFQEPPGKVAKLEEDGDIVVRKGQRHRRTRGEKEVKISSSQNLKQLKLEIMKLFSIPPFDQNLFVDGRELVDDSALLSELRVRPGSVITLKADEVTEEPMFLEDSQTVSGIPESGFKGTGLLGT